MTSIRSATVASGTPSHLPVNKDGIPIIKVTRPEDRTYTGLGSYANTPVNPYPPAPKFSQIS